MNLYLDQEKKKFDMWLIYLAEKIRIKKEFIKNNTKKKQKLLRKREREKK